MIGTRPEAIKMAPVAFALAARGRRPSLVLTGQHPTLDPADFGLERFPAVHLQCPGERDPHAHVRKVTAALLPLLRHTPDLLLVQGDTSSALGAALAGFMAGVQVGHVEAGLRTHDPRLPWPEEEYRVAIDAQSALLFAPTATAAANLRSERVAGEIHLTGNTAIDAVLATISALPRERPRETGMKRLLVTCHRRESWGRGLRSIASALIELSHRDDVQIDVLLHPNPHVGSAMRRQLEGQSAICLTPSVSHAELLQRMRDCDLILSDSGGIQEEAPALGTPLLVLREKTERPEAITCGSARLVGTSAERIVSEANRLLDDPEALAGMSERRFPFGDGSAGRRIAQIVDAWLEGAVAPICAQRNTNEPSSLPS